MVASWIAAAVAAADNNIAAVHTVVAADIHTVAVVVSTKIAVKAAAADVQFAFRIPGGEQGGDHSLLDLPALRGVVVAVWRHDFGYFRERAHCCGMVRNSVCSFGKIADLVPSVIAVWGHCSFCHHWRGG